MIEGRDIYHENCILEIVTSPYWWYVNIDSGNGLVPPSDNQNAKWCNHYRDRIFVLGWYIENPDTGDWLRFFEYVNGFPNVQIDIFPK